MKIALKSLGCAKNQVDAEYLLGDLVNAGHEITSDFEKAECILVNTCGFIESAKKESIEEIFTLLEYKLRGQCRYMIVTGCLAQRYADEIKREIPEVDAVIGVGAIKHIREFLESKEITESNVVYGEGYFLNTADMPRFSLTSENYSTFIKIADGCDNRCTYCAIPNIRGPYKSRQIEDIISEAKNKIISGVKEINIIAQDTASYGKDIYGKRILADLLEKIARINGDFWIRVLYCYPEYIDERLLNVIASSSKICKYIDMPIQHVHPEIVKNMNRRLSGEQILKLIEKIRKTIPEIAIRSTFLVGFPGERKEHFNYLYNFVKEANLDWAGVFAYSKEENTRAYNLSGHIPTKTKEKRREKLTDLQNKITEEKLHNFIGRTLRVLIEGKSELNSEIYEGRSTFHAPEVDGTVYFTSVKDVKKGDFTEVEITHADGLNLIGEKKI